MKNTRLAIGVTQVLVAGITIAAYSMHASTAATPRIDLLRTPHNGIQPQVALDRNGVLHLIYFEGDASGGEIEYVKREPGKDFSRAIRVNSKPASAVAVGTVRGPQMALGRNGRVYVVWLGPQARSGDPAASMPVFFSRLNDSGTAFEPQRNLMQYTTTTDGGLSVAADVRGSVYAVWHAAGERPGEEHRRVYLAHSADDGKHFSREVAISPAELGACGCCGMRAFVDESGTLYILYRAAAESVHRDMTLLISKDHGSTFRSEDVAPWNLNACPMSTAYLSEGGHRVLAAWETAGEVYFDQIDPISLKLSPPIAAPGTDNNRKHPAVAATSNRQLLVWTEGTGWSKGGSLAWQLYDNSGTPIGSSGHAPGVPAWGLPSVFADRNGNFTVVY